MRGRALRAAHRVYGAVAQLGERRVRNAKVEGSIPFRSTRYPSADVQSGTSAFILADLGSKGGRECNPSTACCSSLASPMMRAATCLQHHFAGWELCHHL